MSSIMRSLVVIAIDAVNGLIPVPDGSKPEQEVYYARA